MKALDACWTGLLDQAARRRRPAGVPAKLKGFIISGDVPVRLARYALGMNVTRHFSDTRTDEGRVRFLLLSGQVALVAEGQGWQSSTLHDTLDDAALWTHTEEPEPFPSGI